MINEKEAIKLLINNGFKLLHSKGTHIKYGKDNLRFILTKGGSHGSGSLHPKQEKELLNLIKGIENNKTIESHGDTKK